MEYLAKNIDLFENSDKKYESLELNSRSLLIENLERSNNSEEATKHCIAIAKMGLGQTKPLYQIAPKYPTEAARDGITGWAKLSFKITAKGFVKDIESGTFKGHRDFIKESIKALKQWRYAPKLKNGKPVEAASNIQLDFKLGKKVSMKTTTLIGQSRRVN